ncbi:MAG: InlB B-repeat-containing protein, partial [Verrucomicrobiota bacterium]
IDQILVDGVNNLGAVSSGSYTFSAVTATHTIAASFASNTYTVTYNSNGGSAVSSQPVTRGGTATQPSAPTKPGYMFGGWYSDSGLTTVFSFATTITAETTLYAQWLTPYQAWLGGVAATGANLREFAFGTTNAGALVLDGNGKIVTRGQGPIIQTTVGSPLVQLTYIRLKDSGCTYSAEFSDTLNNYLASTDASFIYPPAVPTEVIVDNGDGMEVVSVKFPIFKNNGGNYVKMQQNFCRIAVTTP